MEISVGIRELFGSLSVGILSILCLTYFYWIFLKNPDNFITWITKHQLVPRGNLGVLLVTILIIILGHITQDLTDYLTDSDSLLPTYYPFLKTEKEHRFNTLVRTERKDGKEIYTLKALGKEIFRHRHLTQSKIIDRNDFLLTEDPESYLSTIDNYSISERQKRLNSAKNLINRIYYQAKNWVYSQENYYNILRGIQIRIDFSRSLHLTSTFFLIILIFYCLIVVLINRSRKIKSPAIFILQKKIWVVILILLCLSCLTLFGYNHTENMFNERAFGKYISHFDHNNISPQPNIVNNAVWWVNQSLDYKVLTEQIYVMATEKLDEALSDKTWTASIEQEQKENNTNYAPLPPAIIMDIDETVLDNSFYQNQLIQSNSFYTSSSWDKWIQQQQAKLVPGAKEFIKNARDKEIKIFYVTNRECNDGIREGQQKCPQENDTIQNLTTKGIENLTEDKILLQNEQEGWEKNKSSRREFLAKDYRIIMLIGDDLHDFLSSEKLKNLSDNDFFEKYKNYLGKKWFLLPNPIYGSWIKRVSVDR